MYAVKVMRALDYSKRSSRDWVEVLYCPACGLFGPHPVTDHDCRVVGFGWGPLSVVLANMRDFAVAPDSVYEGGADHPGAWKVLRKAAAAHPRLVAKAARRLVLAGWGNRPEAVAALRAIEWGDQ